MKTIEKMAEKCVARRVEFSGEDESPFNYPDAGNRGEEHRASELLRHLKSYCGKGRGE